MADDGGNPVQSVGTWLSVLMAGLVGGLSFIGLKQEEVAVLLRNEYLGPSFIALLIALALAVSVVSVFLTTTKIRLLWALALVSAAAALVPFTIRAIPTAYSTSKSRNGALALGIFLVFAAVVVAVLEWRKQPTRNRPVGLQPVALVVAVFLAASAVYAAMRLETRSQRDATGAQVDETVTSTADGAKISLKIRAAKLGRFDDVGIAVRGALRTLNLGSEDNPCFNGPGCDFLAGAVFKPNAFGNVDDVLEVPIDAAKYQHLNVVAQVCLVRRTFGEGTPCAATRDTSADFRVPPPPPPKSGAGSSS